MVESGNRATPLAAEGGARSGRSGRDCFRDTAAIPAPREERTGKRAEEDGAETEASVEPPGADCIPRDEDLLRPDRQGGCLDLPTVTQLFARNSA